MWFVVWCLYVMVFGPFPKSKKAKAKAYCCVSNHRPHSQFAPLPDTLVDHVSMDEKYGKVMQVCKDRWGLLGSVQLHPPRDGNTSRTASSTIVPSTPPPSVVQTPPASPARTCGTPPPVDDQDLDDLDDPCALCEFKEGQILVRPVDL